MASIIASAITALLGLIGVIITNVASNRKVESQLVTSQAVTDTKIENLTQEVKKHNDFGTRIPVIEDRMKRLEEDIKEMKDK